MNGLAVLLCAAALGVEHNWRTTEEGQLEYVLQVEPTFLTSLQQGQAVTSKLPATAKEVHRLCLRIASGDVRKAPQRAPELPPLATAEERAALAEPDIPVAVITDVKGEAAQTTDVSHGWQAVSRDRVEYVVQLTPELVSQLREGDEIHMNVYPEAGQIQQFTIVAGQEVLPRKSARPATSPLASKQPKIVTPAAAEQPSIYGSAEEELNPARTTIPRAGEKARRSPSKLTIGDQETEPAETGPYGPAIRNRGGQSAPNLFATESSPEEEPPLEPAEEVPTFDKRQFEDHRFANNSPPNRPKVPRADIVPPEGGEEYVDETKLTEQGTGFTGFEEGGAAMGKATRAGIDDGRIASLENKARKGLSNASTGKTSKGTTAAAETKEKPWGWLVGACLALFFSLGGNVYLGWTAAEFYSRYRLAIERKRGSRDEEQD